MENFLLPLPTRASAEKVRTQTAFWDTTINPGASCAQTLDTLHGTIKWKRICQVRYVPRALAFTWIMPEVLYLFMACLRR